MLLHPFLQFPGLFFLTPLFVPLILRIAVALVFATVAYKQWTHQDTIKETSLPIIGKQSWWVWLSVVAHVAIALALFTGYYAQIAALLGAAVALKHFIFQHRYPTVFPLARGTYFLVIVICLCLVISGAGAFAFDRAGL